MYLRNEDPYRLERELHEAKTALDNARIYDSDDTDLLLTLSNEIADLEQRVNAAWLDQEIEEDSYNY